MIGAAVLPALALLAPWQDTPARPELPSVRPSPVVVTAAPPSAARTPGDRYEHFNRRMFASQQRFDRRFLRPAALGYAHAVPKPVRSGLRHFFANLGEPIVFLNYLLQLKPGKAIETATRFAINSSLGLGGILDVAKTPGIRLPHRPNGFGDTLGVYGVRPGPYLFLPLVGPTDLRDLIGGQADGLVLPLAVGKPFNRLAYQIPKAVLTGLDQRAQADSDLTVLFDGAVDPYATLRSVYLQDRAGEIAQIKGRPRAATPAGELDDPLQDPAGEATQPAARSATPELQDPLADPAAGPTQPAPSAAAPELDDPLADPAAKPPPAPVAAAPAAPARR